MQLPSETESRRPTFRGGVPIVLADGQTWTIPRLRARDSGPEVVWTAEGADAREVGEALQRRWLAVSDGPASLAAASAMFVEAGIDLLTLNYTLTHDQARSLVYAGFWETYRIDGWNETFAALHSIIGAAMADIDRIRAALPPVVGGKPIIGLN